VAGKGDGFMNDFNLREALDHEYARGLKDGHSSGLLEATAKEQARAKAAVKAERDKFRDEVDEAAAPLMNLLRLYIEGGW
jgi:flagellar biosynthesis/type III secretory pathway protein FliH